MVSENGSNRLLTPEQAAELLQVSVRTMYDWLRTGQVPGTQIGGRLWRVRENDILTPNERTLLEQGLICDANCRVQEGAAYFKRALELKPLYNLANLCLGNMYYRWSHFPEAVEPLKRAIELNPEWVAPYGLLGMNYNHWGSYAAAEVVLRKVIDLAPNHAEGYYQLGYSLLQQFQKRREAIDALENAVRLDPKHIMAYSFLGDLLINEGSFHRAREVYNTLKELNDSFAVPLLRHIEGAEQAIERII